MLLQDKQYNVKAIAFCNTSFESDLTYEFIDKYNDYLLSRHGIGVTCLEPQFESKSFREVRISELITDGSIIMNLIKIKGILPWRRVRFCTQRLKVEPALAFRNSLGDDICEAIGFRLEETHRAKSVIRNATKHKTDRKLCFPLIEKGYNRGMVYEWAANLAEKINLPKLADPLSHLSNCVGCFMKPIQEQARSWAGSSRERNLMQQWCDIERDINEKLAMDQDKETITRKRTAAINFYRKRTNANPTTTDIPTGFWANYDYPYEWTKDAHEELGSVFAPVDYADSCDSGHCFTD